jgi:hypothetical protein
LIEITIITTIFLDRGLLLTRKLLNQGFLLVKLKSSLRKLDPMTGHDLTPWVKKEMLTTLKNLDALPYIEKDVDQIEEPGITPG